MLKENTQAYILLSNPRKVPGHFLVIPKRHAEKPWELERDEILGIFSLISFVEQRITAASGTGADIRQHYRPFLKEGPTKVNHVHFHVLPRTLNDALHLHSAEDKLWENLSEEEHDRIAKLLE